MALSDPVAAYNAANNMEANYVRDALVAAGIEAFTTEDHSVVGIWVGGLVPEIHKPQVWIERADTERAKPVLDEYERRAAELRATQVARDEAADAIEVVCEECGARSPFPAAQKGSVQQCPQCGAFLDVGDQPEDWDDGEPVEEEP